MVLDAGRSVSTPLATSTPNGLAAAIASATLSGVSPPARIAAAGDARASSQSNVSPVPPWPLGRVGVEEVEVGAEGAGGLHRRRGCDAERLDHLAAGSAGDLGAVAGPSSPWSWTSVSAALGGVDDLIERGR